MEMPQKFIFSIIMAVCNTAPYLEDSVGSLLAQSIGFEQCVQLILVDDGSTDGSGLICDAYQSQYSRNVVVFHQKKLGVSAARNCGLSVAAGMYIGFLDSDDRLSHNTLQNVEDFFRQHGEETDVVSIPIHWFGGKKGAHQLNYKYCLGSRVISLEAEPTCIQMSISSAFISYKALDFGKMRFDENLAVAEDAKLLQKILLGKRTLGVAADCAYYYRRRTGADRSTLQRITGSSHWYESHMRHFVLETLAYCKKTVGCVPRFVQYAVLYDIQWRLIELAKNDSPQPWADNGYKAGLEACLREIDTDIILSQKNISEAIKLYLLRLKYKCIPQIDWQQSSLCVRLAGHNIACKKIPAITFDFISWKESCLTLEGRLTFPFCDPEPEIFVQWDGRCIRTARVRPASQHYQPQKLMGDALESVIGFHVHLPIDRRTPQYQGTFWCGINGADWSLGFQEFGNFCPIGMELKNAYYLKDPWTMLLEGNSLCLRQETVTARGLRKIRYLNELWHRDRQGKAAVFLRVCAAIAKKLIRKPIWLLSDRISTAGDNGEALFQYLRRETSGIHLCFLLCKGSVDRARLKKIGTVLNFFSFPHKICHLLCEFIMSSHADHYTTNPFGDSWIYYRDLQVHQKFVFLQHGIIKDDLSNWLNRFNKNIYGFVVSTQRERESIINGRYDYPEHNVWLTGLCRYDLLYHNEKRLITIMPTWRKYLMGRFSEETGIRMLNQSFYESDYFLFYSALLTDHRLLDAAKRYGYQICFYPHPQLQPYIDKFQKSSSVLVFPPGTLYRDVFAQSELIITDYSSVAFDFAYLRKPVLYCRPDHQKFIGGTHVYTPGYFSYWDDGFGEVTHDLEETIEQATAYMRNGCVLKEKYRKRIDNFFTFHDSNCRLRLWKKIKTQ